MATTTRMPRKDRREGESSNAARRARHTVQFYEDHAAMIEDLAALIGGAIGSGEAAVVIATEDHRRGLERLLESRGTNIESVRKSGRYLSLDAVDLASQLIKGEAIDEARFAEVTGRLIKKIRTSAGSGRRVTIFGEMVAVLWEQGRREAALELERLWNRLTESFDLRCAYPMFGFGQAKDGESFRAICSEHSAVVPPRSDRPRGDPSRTIAILEQQTHALENELKLLQQEEQWRLLIEHVQDYAIFMLDTEGRISTWNPGAERIKGYSAPEILGRHFSIFYTPEDKETGKPERALKTAAADGRFSDEGWRLRKDGSKFWANVLITALRDRAGDLRGYAKITRDQTAQKQHEESLHRLSSQILAVQDEERRRLARELHDSAAQNLTALSLNLATLRRLDGYSTNPKTAQMLMETSALASKAMQEIRAISYGMFPPTLDHLGLVESVNWFLSGFVQRTNMQIDWEPPDEFGRLPAETEMALFRIIQESLTNAHRHSASQTASVRLEKQDGQVALSVRDYGKGIPHEKLDPLHAAPGALGIGIRAMAERIRQLNGRMEIKNAQPGLLVEVTLPIPDAPPAS